MVRPTQLLDAALALFARKGFHAASMGEIGALAGVSKATVHLYFGCKEDLFTAALLHVTEPLLQKGEDTIAEWRGSMSSLLRHLVLAWLDIARSHRVGEILKLMLAEGGRFPVLAQQGEALILRAHALVASLVERGVQSGEFLPCDAAATAHVLLAPLGFRELCKCSNGAFGEAGEPDDAYFSTYLDLVLHGLGGEALAAAAGSG